MKKVNLSDIEALRKDGWKLSESDLAAVKSGKSLMAIVATIDKFIVSQNDIAKKNNETVNILTKNIVELTKKAREKPALKPKKSILKPEVELKKKFRCTWVKDKNGDTKYVDIEQL